MNDVRACTPARGVLPSLLVIWLTADLCSGSTLSLKDGPWTISTPDYELQASLPTYPLQALQDQGKIQDPLFRCWTSACGTALN